MDNNIVKLDPPPIDVPVGFPNNLPNDEYAGEHWILYQSRLYEHRYRTFGANPSGQIG